jgi:hypothetical protein
VRLDPGAMIEREAEREAPAREVSGPRISPSCRCRPRPGRSWRSWPAPPSRRR